jgi:hypothetical protein
MDSIGIIALLLAIPLSVLANLLTPTVKNWLSQFSRKRLLKRIENLEFNLRRFDKEKDVSYSIELLENGIIIVSFLAFGFYAYLSTIMLEKLLPAEQTAIYIYLALAALSTMIAYTRGVITWSIIRHTGSLKYKKKLEKNIASLKNKLDKNFPVDNTKP